VLPVWEYEDVVAWLGVPVAAWLGVPMYNACSRVVVSSSALYVGSARDASSQAVLVYGRAPKIASLGSWNIYILLGSQWKGEGVAVYDS
jgi:hypothetical protein